MHGCGRRHSTALPHFAQRLPGFMARSLPSVLRESIEILCLVLSCLSVANAWIIFAGRDYLVCLFVIENGVRSIHPGFGHFMEVRI